MPSYIFSESNPSVCFASHAKKTPNRIAVTDFVDDKERSFTFGQLEERIQSIGAYLVNMKITAGDRMAVVSQNRYEIVAVFLAAMRIGVVPFSVNPHFTKEHMRHVFQDAMPSCAFIEDGKQVHTLEIAKEYTRNNPVIFAERLDRFAYFEDVMTYPHQDLPILESVPRGIIYTSGSTGFPKGVLRSLNKVERTYPFKAMGVEIYENEEEFLDTPTIAHLPMFHGGGLGPVWDLLSDGSPLVIMRRFDPVSYLRLLAQYQITHAAFLPNLLSMCLKERALIQELNLALKLVSVGGGPCSPDTLRMAREVFRCPALSGYGMTEGGPMLTFDGIDLDTMPVGCCGKAEEGALIKLVDASGKEGNFGELWFKNETLLDEYINRPDLMEDRFRDGWFRTRDIFLRDADGFYWHKGRADDMFVCDGENIYPQEIEDILSQHPDVLQACVVPLADSVHGHIPGAMVICQSGDNVTEKSLRKHYLHGGPMYAYPRIIMFVDSFPSLGPGKVDRPGIIRCLEEEYSKRQSRYSM